VQISTDITTMADHSPGSAASGITPTVSPSPAKNTPHHGLFMQGVVIPTRPRQSTTITSRETPGKIITIADPPPRRSVLDAVVTHKSRAQSSLAMRREKNRSKIPVPVGKEEQFEVLQEARRRTSFLTAAHIRRWLRAAIIRRYRRLMQRTEGSIASPVTRSRIPIPIGKEQEFLALSAAGHRMSNRLANDTGMQVPHAPKLVASVATPELEATDSPIVTKPKSRPLHKWAPPIDKRVIFIPGEQ
jgi:hypothetical protein